MGLKAYECGLAYWYAIIAEDGRFIWNIQFKIKSCEKIMQNVFEILYL